MDSTVSTAGYCAVRQTVQVGVEKTTSDGRPSGAVPRAVQRPSAGLVRKPATPRPNHQRAKATVAARATAATARTSARSTISGPTQDAAPIQLRHDKTQRTEVEARIQCHHDRDGKREHPGDDRIARQQ